MKIGNKQTYTNRPIRPSDLKAGDVIQFTQQGETITVLVIAPHPPFGGYLHGLRLAPKPGKQTEVIMGPEEYTVLPITWFPDAYLELQQGVTHINDDQEGGVPSERRSPTDKEKVEKLLGVMKEVVKSWHCTLSKPDLSTDEWAALRQKIDEWEVIVDECWEGLK